MTENISEIPMGVLDPTYNVDPEEWFATRSRQLRVLNPNGSVAASCDVASLDTVGEFMLKAGLLKENAATQAIREGKAVRPAVDPDLPMPRFKQKSTPAKVASAKPEPESLSEATIPPALPGFRLVPESVNVTSLEVAPKIEERIVKVADYSGLGLLWVQENPDEPRLRATFDTPMGSCETCYHAIIRSEADNVLYLVFDTRYSLGRFSPKLGSNLTKLTLYDRVNDHYTGTLWTDAKFTLGVFEITPFVCAQPEEEGLPEEEEEEIPDY